MLFVLYGTDRLAVRERREALLREQLPTPDDQVALVRLDGQKCGADDLSRAVQALPFFGDRRVVLVDDLLTRFETKRRRGETEDGAADESSRDPPMRLPASTSGKNDGSRGFIAALSAIAPSTTLILWERGTISKTNPLLKAAARDGTLESYAGPQASEIEDWIFARARGRGVRLKPDVPRLLAEHLGQDLEVLDTELEKLALFVGADGLVDAGAVRTLTAQTRQGDTLQLLNAASDRRTGEALSLLHELLANGVSPAAVVGMLGSQVRKLLQVQALVARRVAPGDIAARLALHPYVVRLTTESLRYYSSAGLRELHRHLVAIDQAVKTGQADGESALELLVWDLARGAR